MPNLSYVSECLSTNDEITHFLPQKGSDFFALYTFNQTKGKGQYGNSWDSSVNLNIAYTLALKCGRINYPDMLFNFHTANVLRTFLANLTRHKVETKWPNDIIIHGKKVSGMLIERKKINEEWYFLIGIGLNVLQKNFNNLPKAGSLNTQADFYTENLHDVVAQMHYFFEKNIFESALPDEVLKEYNEHLFRKGMVSVFEKDGLRQNGIIRHADLEGKLWIELENDGIKRFFNKEITLLY